VGSTVVQLLNGSIATVKLPNTPDAEQFSIAVANRHISQMLRKIFNCQNAYPEQYCNITKRRILHKLRRIEVANGVYCRY
jgi:hypothetical protein